MGLSPAFTTQTITCELPATRTGKLIGSNTGSTANTSSLENYAKENESKPGSWETEFFTFSDINPLLSCKTRITHYKNLRIH